MDRTVIKMLTHSTSSIWVNENELKSKKPTTYTALISGVKEVYNLFPGSVLYYGTFDGMGTINIAVSNHEILRYLYLIQIEPWIGSNLSQNQPLGLVSKRGLGIEYCTQWRGDSKYPVRVLNRTYYKQNPKDILDGLYVPPKESDVEYGISRPNDIINLTETQWSEWQNNASKTEWDTETRILASLQYPDSD